jgi:hypothetical protein
MHPEEADDLAADRLVGAEAIAEYRGEPVRRTRHLLDLNLIPHGKEGRLIVASKRKLREHWAQTTGGDGKPPFSQRRRLKGRPAP